MKQQAKSRNLQQPEYIFQVETLSHEGRGIAHYGSHPEHPADKHGKKVFIRYALPGETVKARITHQAKRLEEAEMLQLLGEPSAHRIEQFVLIMVSVVDVACSIFILMNKSV